MRVLRQLTETGTTSVQVGPMVDFSGAVLTSLSISQSDCMLSLNGGARAAKNATGGGIHQSGGYYAINLDDTDLGTKGHLRLSLQMTGALPDHWDFLIVDPDVYDACFASGLLPVNLEEIAGETDLVDALGASLGSMLLFTVQASPTPETVSGFSYFAGPSTLSSEDNFYRGLELKFRSPAALADQGATVDTYTGATRLFKVAALTDDPSSGDPVILY